MKKSCNILRTVQFVFILMATCVQFAYAQESVKDRKAAEFTSTKNLIESKHYVFDVQSVSPATGHTRQLTPYYTLEVNGDTLVSDLPYYGRAYVAPIDPSNAGFNFTATKFSYTINNRKKGGWDILIEPKDGNDVRQMSLTVYQNGSANLVVISNNRQSISYYGQVSVIVTKNK